MTTLVITLDQIIVAANGAVLYRETTEIMDDNVKLSKTYHRSNLIPGQDLTDVPASVVAICNTAWTPEVIAAYQAQLEAQIV